MTIKQRAESREQRGRGKAQAGSLCHYGLQFAGPRRNVRRGRRGWGATVLTLLTLLTVSALAGWVWHCVRAWMGTGWKAYATPVRGLAMWPVPVSMTLGGAIVWGVVMVCAFVIVVTWVRAWLERVDEETEAEAEESMLRAVLDPHAGDRVDDEAQAGKPMLLETTCPHCGKSMFVRPSSREATKDRGEGAV